MESRSGSPGKGVKGNAGPKVYGWTKEGKLIISTGYYASLPGKQLVLVDPVTLVYSQVALAQADEGVFDESGNLYFTRLSFQGSHTRRYKGGTAQNLWKFDGKDEAKPLTADYAGTSKNPMFYHGRLYFLSDRDGTMNLWSMLPDATDLKQHTHSVAWDLKDAELQNGKVIYQKQADLFVFDLTGGTEKQLDIKLVSDFDQKRPVWEKDPMKKIQGLSLSKTGSHVLLTARGRVFSTPVDGGRWAEITRKYGIRFKTAKFSGDKDDVLFISDESGEMELWKTDKNGFSIPSQLTQGSKLLIMDYQPSPNGKYIAYTEKDYALKLYDAGTKTVRQIDQGKVSGISDMKWSPDSKWLV